MTCSVSRFEGLFLHGLQWGITVANVSDFKRPPELLSYPQQLAVTLTGLIWTRYSTVITPVGTPVSSPDLQHQLTYVLSRCLLHGR